MGLYAVGSATRKTFLVTLDVLIGFGLIAGAATLFRLPMTLGTASLVPALIVGLYVAGQYDEYHPHDLSSALGVYALTGASILGAGVVVALLGGLPMDWAVVFLFCAVIDFCMAGWRVAFRVWISRSMQSEPVVLIGAGDALAEGSRAVRKAPHLIVADVVESPNPDSWVAVIEDRLRKRGVNRVLVVVGFDAPLTDPQSAMLVRLRRLGADITPVVHLIELLEERIPISLTRGDSLEGWDRIQQAGHEVSLRIKRVSDIAGALVLGTVLGIPALVAGIATRLSDGGPALYRQRRVGKDGHIFEIIKIRSMVLDAEKVSGATWSTEEDPRITRLGRFLRKTRLDEVPQFWNVLLGEMSLVGPRPERPEFTDRLAEKIPLYDSRHIVNPGLTGWAQVRLPYGSSVDDSLAKLEYDLYYIRHWNLWFDLRILLRTIGVVLFRQGGR
jgi:exopolysaccharide biosynthesis polyprenyl glycosylphosphotransferase